MGHHVWRQIWSSRLKEQSQEGIADASRVYSPTGESLCSADASVPLLFLDSST